MLPFIIILIVIGATLEIISLRRDPALVEHDYSVSTGSTEPGKPFVIRSILTNKSRIPVSYLAVREVYPEAVTIPAGVSSRATLDGLNVKNICRVKGLERKKIALELTIAKRGVHVFTGDSIEFGDFLGFRVVSKKSSYQREIVVYPEKLDDPALSQALSSYCGDMASKRFLIRDPILTAGIREYTGREPMKEINWLQSARRGELMVREFEYNRQPSTCVVLSVDGVAVEDEAVLDKCCSTSRTICEALVKTGACVNFYTNSFLLRKGRNHIWKCEVSPGHTGELLEGLGRVTAAACTDVDKLLQYVLRESDPNAEFIVVLPECDKQGIERTNALSRQTGREFMVQTC